MSSNCYGAGKSKGPSYSSGKKPASHGAKPTYSSGKDSGTARKGDSSSSAAGQGKK